MTMRVAIRGFAFGEKIFEDNLEWAGEDLDGLIPALVEKHARDLREHPKHMIEIEFVDDPDRLHAFFRFGTDPSGMTRPLAIDLTGDKSNVN